MRSTAQKILNFKIMKMRSTAQPLKKFKNKNWKCALLKKNRFSKKSNRLWKRAPLHTHTHEKSRLLQVRSMANEFRARIPSRHIYYYRSSQHDGRWILSFAFIFESSDPVQFAYCIPYTYTYMQQWLQELDNRKYSFYHRDLLTYTVVSDKDDML